MDSLRSGTVSEAVDYQLVMDALSQYQKPRDKLTRLLHNEDLIRIKKGLYIFGPRWRRGPIQEEALANLIYGPSYVSKEWALGKYGFIPEAVHEVTSVTTGRNRLFETPLRRFSYQHLSIDAYAVGFDWRPGDPEGFLVATPEKAVADIVAHFHEVSSVDELLELLTEDLRIDEGDLQTLRIGRLIKISRAYNQPTVTLLPNLVRSLK